MRAHQMQVAAIVAADRMSPASCRPSARALDRRRQQWPYFMRLKPRSERQLNADEVIQELRPKLAGGAGHQCLPAKSARHPHGWNADQGIVSISVCRTRIRKELYDAVPKLIQGMSELPGFQDVDQRLLVQNPELTVEINRDRRLFTGRDPDRLRTRSTMPTVSAISTIYTDINEYWG